MSLHPEVIHCTCRSAVACRVPHGVWLAELATTGTNQAASPTGYGPPFLAQYASTCGGCGGTIAPGNSARMRATYAHHDILSCCPI